MMCRYIVIVAEHNEASYKLFYIWISGWQEKGVGSSFRLVPVNLGSWRFLQVGACKPGSWCSHPVGVGKAKGVATSSQLVLKNECNFCIIFEKNLVVFSHIEFPHKLLCTMHDLLGCSIDGICAMTNWSKLRIKLSSIDSPPRLSILLEGPIGPNYWCNLVHYLPIWECNLVRHNYCM